MKKYILVGRLIDGSGSGVRKRVALVEEDGTILDCIPAASVPSSGPETIVDMSHCTIMPPLMDCSIDLASSASLDIGLGRKRSDKEKAAVVARHIHFCHSHGVLGLADCRDNSTADDEAVTVRSAGQVYFTSEHNRLRSDVDGLDFIKIVHSENIEAVKSEPDGPGNKERDNLQQLVQEAHDRGKSTIVLANGHKKVREALDSECDAIEQGYEMGEENLEIMASRKILWIPCLVRAKMHKEVATASQQAEAAKLLKRQQVLLRKAHSLNFPVAVGTGAGSPGIIHGESVIEEIQQFVKSGYSLIEALRAASLTGAEFFKIPQIGILQRGSMANFIVSRGMVQQLPRKLFYLENIYWLGRPSQGYRKNPVKTVQRV